MIPPAHIICAFSQALYKLHSLLTPLDAVKAMLGVTEGNQRVLLHRGRSRLRTLLNEEMVP